MTHGEMLDEVGDTIGRPSCLSDAAGLVASVRQLNPSIVRYEGSGFTGGYVTGVDDLLGPHVVQVTTQVCPTQL